MSYCLSCEVFPEVNSRGKVVCFYKVGKKKYRRKQYIYSNSISFLVGNFYSFQSSNVFKFTSIQVTHAIPRIDFLE